LEQLKDAVRDGLRAIKNAIDDRAIVPGAGAFEVAVSQALQRYKEQVKGKQRLGVQAYADALLVIPKTLGKHNIYESLFLLILSNIVIINFYFYFTAVNSGFDPQDTIVKLFEESSALGEPVGLDLSTGEALKAADAGIYDNYNVKKQIINSW